MRELSAGAGRLLRRPPLGAAGGAVAPRALGGHPLGAAGGLIVLAVIVVAVLAPRLAPHGPKDTGFAPYLPPSAEFPMGTDQVGRDVLSRVIWGARLSLYVGLVSVVFGITAGALRGGVPALPRAGPPTGHPPRL